MKSFVSATALLTGIVFTAPSLAQTTRTDDTGWRMPHERGFWGHAGISAGQAELDVDCAAGAECDTDSAHLRAFAGGRFNNAVGMEVGFVNFGKFKVNGGDTDGWGVDLALVAGFPIGSNSAIFGKAGVTYARMEVDAAAAGFPSGKERGFGPRFGIGGQIGLTPNWAVRADLDRYRLPFPGGKEDVDAFTLGVQYTFR